MPAPPPPGLHLWYPSPCLQSPHCRSPPSSPLQPYTCGIFLQSHVEGQLVSHGAGGGKAAQVLGLYRGVSLLGQARRPLPLPTPPHSGTHHAAVCVPQQDGMAVQECPVAPALGRLWGGGGHRVSTESPKASGRFQVAICSP